MRNHRAVSNVRGNLVKQVSLKLKKKNIYISTGVKQYSCEKCKKSFSQAKELKILNRTHTSEKLYAYYVLQLVIFQLIQLDKAQKDSLRREIIQI